MNQNLAINPCYTIQEHNSNMNSNEILKHKQRIIEGIIYNNEIFKG